MPTLPLIQRPESVASEKRSYRLSLNNLQSSHRRCKTFPGNEKAGAQLIDNEVNNETLKEPESFIEQFFLANKELKHDYDNPPKYHQVPSPTPTYQKLKKIKSLNRRSLPRWVSRLGLWLPPQKKLLLYETFAKHVELLDRSKAHMLDPFPHLERCGHARTLSALERQQLRLQMEEHYREAERFERLLERFNKITETWANLQKLADTRETEHNARLQAFKKAKDQYVDPQVGIKQKRVERDKLEREKRRLQDEARERELAERRRKIPTIMVTDYDKEMRPLKQSSLSSIRTETNESSLEAVKIKLEVPVCEKESDYPTRIENNSEVEDAESEEMDDKNEGKSESEQAPSPIPSPVVEIPGTDNEGEYAVDSDVAMSFLAPPSMTSLAHEGILIGDDSVSADDTAGLMTGITPIPFGLSTGLIPDTAIRSSSSIDRYHTGAQARLNNTKQMKRGGAWCPKISSDKEYLEVDLGSQATVMQVATQGYPGDKNVAKKDLRWVMSYSLGFSNDGKKWEKYQQEGTVKVFKGNVDNNTVVLHSLPTPVEARYVKFYPKTWRNGIAMRTEVFGAFADDDPEPLEPTSPELTLSEPAEDLPSEPEPSRPASPEIKPPSPVTQPLTPPLEVEEESENLEQFKVSLDQMIPMEGWEEETIKTIADALSEEDIEEHEVRLSSALSIQGSKQNPKARRKRKKSKTVKKEKKKKPSKKKHVKLPVITSAMNDLPEAEDDDEEPEEDTEPEELFRIPTPPLPEIPKTPVDVPKPARKESIRVSMFPTKPDLKQKDTTLSRARADNSIRDELLRQQLADERKKKLLSLNKKKVSTVRRSPIDFRFSIDDDDSFIFKYCILNEGQLGYYRRIFESIDDDQDGFLFPEEILDALECVNKNLLNDSHLKYILRVLELCDYSLDSGADFKFFSVIAAFSQKIAALDDYAKILISKLDFRELDYKLQRARSLFKCYADENTGKMSMEHLTLELTVGGLDINTKDHVLQRLGPTTYLDFLDFLTYIPLFIHIHDHVLANPLHDPRLYPSARRQTIY